MSITVTTALSREQAEQIRTLARAAKDADGVAPLNEASLLAVESMSGVAGDADGARVWLAEHDGAIVAVAIDAEGDVSGVDLAVAPSARRQGVGATLADAVLQADAAAQFWAHGDLAPAQGLAAKLKLTMVRDLWKMARPLSRDEWFDTALPDGFVARPYDGSQEQAQAWLDVNATSFASHPEQGRMTIADFQQRAEEEWFKPEGLILVWDETVSPAALAASHWTKSEPESDTGEVYVVAVAPAYQGRGLARPLTNLGLAFLAESGATTVELYVEGDNEPAKATYLRAGFTLATHDALYRSVAH